MQLKLFKTLWGFTGDYKDAVQSAIQNRFDGIEGAVPDTVAGAEQLATLLADSGLNYIAELATTGTYVPDRSLTIQDHLDDLAIRLTRLKYLRPLFVTCLGGCDSWRLPDSLEFLRRAIELADNANIHISFETHRGRSLFNPWITRQIIDLIPELQITCDFSHWYVVCEGIQASEESIIREVVSHASHIHARVGYDQGPQVPDPRSPLYARELARHLTWWGWIWQQHAAGAREYTTVTSEFGPDGYDYRDSTTGRSLIEPELLNNWMAARLRSEYKHLITGQN